MKRALFPLYAGLYAVSHRLKRRIVLPSVVTYTVTERCEGKCKTCGIWQNEAAAELSTDEWIHVIEGFKTTPVWVTLTGGDQSSREDFPVLVRKVADINKPSLITIPLTVIHRNRTMQMVSEIIRIDAPLFLNFSIDGPEHLHDEIRGIPGSFRNTKELIAFTRDHAPSTVKIGVYSIISKENVMHLDDVLSTVKKLSHDHYGFEIAEERKELMNPFLSKLTKEEQRTAIEFLRAEPEQSGTGLLALKHSLRNRYYKSLSEEKKRKCYAGIASIQIGPDGKVLQCGIKGKVMGDLKAHGYDIRQVLRQPQANKVMQETCLCSCTHCTPRYLSSLIDLTDLENAKAFMKMIRSGTDD